MLPRKRPPDWALAVLLIAGLYLWQRTTFPLWMTDVLPIQLAAYQWKQGDIEWIYAPVDRYGEWHMRSEATARSLGGEGFGNPYFLPPFVAGLLSPFSEAHALAWRNTLFAINIILTLALAYQTARLSVLVVSVRSFLWALALVLIAFPTSRATHLGQFLPMLAAGTWAGLLLLRERNELPAGMLLGAVSAIKLFPFGLIALPAITQRFRTVAVWISTVIAIYALSVLMLGTRIHALFWEAARQFGSKIYPFYGNQSLTGWYVRLFRERDLWEITPYMDPGVQTAHYVIVAAVAGTTLLWMWRYRRGLNRETFPAFAGLLTAGLLLSLSNAWDHYWLFALPVIGWAIHEEWTGGTSRVRMLWIFAAAFLCVMKLTRFYTDSVTGRIMTGSQAAGMAMFWIYLLWRVRRSRMAA